MQLQRPTLGRTPTHILRMRTQITLCEGGCAQVSLQELAKTMSNQEKFKSGVLWTWTTFITAVFEYDTAKIVHIKNKKVGVMNRVIQLGIVLYIIV